jgi:CheY-like chemotaxis protein
LMDCEMPRMNGFEATRIIRKWQGGQSGEACPIVALTAHVLTEHVEQCLAAGMDDHLSKPLHLKELRELLESIESN